MKPTSFIPLLLLLVSGCAASMPAAQAPVGSAVLTLTPRYQAGGYRAQAVVPQLDLARVDHVVLELSRITLQGEVPVLTTGGVPVLADLSRSELNSPITFEHLTANATYRVRAFAYDAPGRAENHQISIDAQSYVDVQVEDDDHPTMAPLMVKLAATPFAATATVNLSATGSVLFTSIDLGFYALQGGAETLLATRSLRAEEVPTSVSFGNLQALTTYRLKAQAKGMSGEAIAGSDAQLNVVVDDDTEVATGSLQITVP